ncbi:hypothetical protein V2J09_023210 [Rumex salicifolius]
MAFGLERRVQEWKRVEILWVFFLPLCLRVQTTTEKDAKPKFCRGHCLKFSRSRLQITLFNLQNPANPLTLSFTITHSSSSYLSNHYHHHLLFLFQLNSPFARGAIAVSGVLKSGELQQGNWNSAWRQQESPGVDDSPAKYGDASSKSRQRKKKKLSDMLGAKWNKDELQRFYDAYRKYGKDWKKVATAIRNRTVEMVESLYTMNRAYLSLPEGTASVVGLIAMMTDHYSNLEGSDSEQESNDGVGVTKKPKKRTHGKLPSDGNKGTDGPVDISQSLASRYGCLSLLKKKRSGGSQPRAVGKRTPRVPVKYTYDITEKYISPSRYGKKVKVDADDDDVAHEVALVLAEASHRGGSPQVSYTPTKKEYSESEMTSGKDFGNRMGDDGGEGSLGSTEADNRDYPGRSYFSDRKVVSAAVAQQKAKKWSGRKHQAVDMKSYHADDVKEACSGTEEGQRVSGAKRKLDHDVADAAGGRSFGPKKKSKKVLFGRDEGSAFDALQTLADLSLMMPSNTETENLSIEEKVTSSKKEALLEHPQTEKVKHVSEKKGDKLSVFRSSKFARPSPVDANVAPEASTRTRKQKFPAPKMPTSDAQINSSVIQSQKKEFSDNVKKSGSRNRRSSVPSQPQVGQLGKIHEHSSSSADVRIEENDLAVTTSDDVNLLAKSKSRRKAINAQIKRNSRDLKFSEAHVKNQSKSSSHIISDIQLSLKASLSNCLSTSLARRWCVFEWFYSAIDFPWFAKSEFVEYLYHVGLGHVPRLTRVEWGVIRRYSPCKLSVQSFGMITHETIPAFSADVMIDLGSSYNCSSLGKPRRFSAQFLKEEKEKLYSYRYSVRTHYSELRNGTREGLPTDLARPLTVGQRVVAIHPRTREIHNGNVLTVDHDKCRIQFDHPELGVEFVMDIDCMPLNPSENMPVYLSRNNFSVDIFLESLKQNKTNEQIEVRKKDEYITFAPIRKMENVDDHPYDATSYPMKNLLPLQKDAITSPTSQIKFGHGEVLSPQQVVVSHPSIMSQMQAKEADIRALAELSRALDRKNALVTELKRMNDDVSEDYSLGDVDAFKKQYAAVLVQLDEVSYALLSLRQRNTYQGNSPQLPQKTAGLDDRGLVTFGCSRLDIQESASHVSEIVETSRIKARKMVDAAMQAMSSFKDALNSAEKIEEAIDYVSRRLFVDESSISALANRANGATVPANQSMSTLSNLSATDHTPDSKSNGVSDLSESQAPVELITNSVATLLMIQKCTERQFPPADVAQVLDLAVMGLHPCSSQNLPIYSEIQKCMGIIRNQILALVPT